jgi:hypothetical protein
LAQHFTKQAEQETEQWNQAGQTVLDPIQEPKGAQHPWARVATEARAQAPMVEALKIAPQRIVFDTAPNAIQPTTTTHYITQDDVEDEPATRHFGQQIYAKAML